MTFTISPASNPDTRGRGQCFTVATEYNRNVRMSEPAASVMFDEYDVTPAIHVTMTGAVRLTAIEDTDDGCYLVFTNGDSDVALLLNGKSVRGLLNSIDLVRDARAQS